MIQTHYIHRMYTYTSYAYTIHILNGVIPHKAIMLSPRAIDYLTKISGSDMRNPFPVFGQGRPKQYRILPLPLAVCLLLLEGKTLLLKTSHSVSGRLGGIKMEMTWSPLT